MRKFLFVLLLGLLSCISVRAQFLGTSLYMPTHKTDTADYRELYHAKSYRPFSVFSGISYAYNMTYGSYGEFALGAMLPVNRTLEVMLAAQATTANTYYFTGTVREIFPIRKGEFFLEETVNDRVNARSYINNFNFGIAGGYRCDYVSLLLGYNAQIFEPIAHDWHQQTDGSIAEPFDGYYRLEVFCRPQKCFWNLSVAITNYNTFLIERVSQPWLILNSHVDIKQHYRLHFGVEIKEAGWFHTTTETYGVTAQAGFEYLF